MYKRRLPNDLAVTLTVLEPYRTELVACAVESTFNWHWLVDGLMSSGYPVKLLNTSAVRQYDGLKHSDDRDDAFQLAHLLRRSESWRRAISIRSGSVRCAICCASGPGSSSNARRTP